MKLSLVDMHCDTVYEAYKNGCDLVTNNLSVSADKATEYEKYTQIMAIWSDKKLFDDEAFEQFCKIAEFLYTQCSSYKNVYGLNKQIHINSFKSDITFIPAVEDARILAGKEERFEVLIQYGVKILTLMWSGCSCIGGAYDTDASLTQFGEIVVSKCFESGIIPDISHASDRSAERVFELNTENRPVIASHSNSRTVFPHKRNLSDSLFYKIKNCNGLVGLNLFCEHLGEPPYENMIIKHIDHWLSIGGENNICLGCDFDGARTPDEYRNIRDLSHLADQLAKMNYSQKLIEKLFWRNAENFIKANIII